jgi:nucleoside-diphosphate-sugar epimerase
LIDFWKKIKPKDLRDRTIFITGGTGIVGRSILDYINYSRIIHGDGVRVVVLSRNVDYFLEKFPNYARSTWLEYLVGDVESLPSPDRYYTDVIHAAADTHFSGSGLIWMDQIVAGTRQALNYAKAAKAERFLLLSSGAIYGLQEDSKMRLFEDNVSAPSTTSLKSIYGQSKRMAEQLCVQFASECDLEVRIARLFAIINSHLPLPGSYAVTNFLYDANFSDAINVQGNKDSMRSYIDGRDMAHWLLTILLDGKKNTAYNVGSDIGISIYELASYVGHLYAPEKKIVCHQSLEDRKSVYLPRIERCGELGLKTSYSLEESLNSLMLSNSGKK